MANVIIRLTIGSNARGPFNVYSGSTSDIPLISGASRFDLQKGEIVDLPGSVNGTEYIITIVDTFSEEYSEYVEKKVVVYDDEEEEQRLIRSNPEMTPTPSALSDYDLYLYRKCNSDNIDVEYKFLNIKRIFGNTDFLMFENECYEKEVGPLKANYKHPYIENNFYNSCNECYIERTKDFNEKSIAPPPTFYAVRAVKCCEEVHQGQTQLYYFNVNFSFFISNPFISPNPSNFFNYVFSYNGECYRILQAFNFTYAFFPNVTSNFFKKCSDCIGENGCATAYKAISCDESLNLQMIVQIDEDLLNYWQGSNPPQLDNENVYVYEGICYQIIEPLNQTPTSQNIDVSDLVLPGIKCSLCDRPVFWSYGLKRCCATYNDGKIYYISGPQDHYIGEGIFWNGDCYTVINVLEDDLGFEFGGNQFYDDCDECEEEAPVHPCPTPTQTVTPSTTMTTPTPTTTATYTPTNSLTASITPTPTKTKFKVRIRRCCGPISASDLYIELNYGLATLVPAVGHVIPYLGTCWRVMQINVGGGPEVYVPEVLVYVNDDPNTACEECILDGNYDCGSLFFTGCTTGQLYRINGTGGNADYVPGQTYYFPAAPPFNNELSYETDYCFTNVIQTIQPNSSSYITLTYGGYPQYPQEVNCEDEQCVYVPPTPTPTVTITPTQSIMFIRLKKCCGGLNSFWRKVFLPNSYAVGDVIRMQNFINCHEIVQISFSFNPDFYQFANIQFHYSDGDSLENCAECVCDADPECNNPDLVCTPPVTETPAVTPSITPTQTRQRGIAVPCCEVDEDQYPNAISVIQFYVPLDAEIGDVIYYDIYPSQAQMVGNCFRIIDLLPMSEQYPGYPYTPTSNTITPQYSSGGGDQNCQNCIDDHPCPIEPSPTPTPTGTPVQTPTPSEVSVVLPPTGGVGGNPQCPEQPCLTFDQNLPRIEDAFLGRACCSFSERRLRIMYLLDVPNNINVPGPNGVIPDQEKTYFKNMMTSNEWSTLLNFIGTNYTYLWNPIPSNPWSNQTDGYGYAQVASLPFIPVYDSEDVTYQESVDRVTYAPQYNSWIYFLTPVTQQSGSFFSLVSQEALSPDYGFGPVNDETHTTALDTILKERYGNNLPVGLLRVIGTLNSVKNLENWKLGGDQDEGTYDNLGNQTEHILSYPPIVDDLPDICEDSYWGIDENQFNPRIAKKIVLFIQDPNSYNGNSLTWGPNTHLTDEDGTFVGTNKVNDPLFTWFQTRFIVEGMQSPFAGKLGNALDPVLGIEDPNDLPDDPTSSVVYHTEIIAVGIGEGSEWEHLEDLASYPDYVHRISDIQQLNDPTFAENLNCQIQQNLCDRDRFGFLWLSGLTTGFIYEFNPETNFYNYYTDTIQEGPLGYFTIGDIVEGKTYVKNYGNPPGLDLTVCGDMRENKHFAVTIDGEPIENWETKYRVVSYKEVYETGKFNYHDWWRTQPIHRRLSCGTYLKIDYYFTKSYEYGYDCQTPGCKYDINPPTLPIPAGADTPQEYQSFSGTLKVRIDVAQDVVELANESGINILSQAIDCGELLKEVIENTPECNFDVEYEVILHTTNDLNGLDRFEYECWLKEISQTPTSSGSIIDTGFHKGCIFTTHQPSPGVVGIATLPGFVCQMCCSSEFILELDIFESAFVHEMGHTFGLHHTFICDRWKKEYPELEKETLDNVLPFNSLSECLECGDYQPYFEETNGKAAIMSYFGYRVDMCGSVRNTFGPLDDDYVPELGYKYVVPTPAGNASTNDFIFDPYRTQNYVNIVGLDKKANITYNKFALDNEFQFGNPQIQSIQVNFKIIGNSNGMGNDFTNLTAKFINSSGGIYQFYTKGINQLNSGVVNTVSHTISSTANPYLSLFDYSDQEGFGIRFEHEFLDESQNNWTFIIRDLNMTFNFSDGSSINKKPKDYYNILEDSTGSYQMKATDTKMYSAERFTSYEGKIIQFYMDMNKNYFDYLN
jgi:hypothetical protein